MSDAPEDLSSTEDPAAAPETGGSPPLGAPIPSRTVSEQVPLFARLAHEIPRPLDWQQFQRQCVILFKSVLGDPHTHEYGRGGQLQKGIDIIGRRGGRGEQWVGIQCRHTAKAPREKKMLEDCRAALDLEADLKEFIFVTTAENTTEASDDAIKVERALKADGHDLVVVVYGWGQLGTLIASHLDAYAAFVPSVVGVSTPQPAALPKSQIEDLATQIAGQVSDKLQRGTVRLPTETPSSRWSHEDAGLHARIDIFRDLFKNDQQFKVAERELQNMLAAPELVQNPWAEYRIHANLGSIALQIGKFDEAAAEFERSYLARPAESVGVAHLALARTMQGRHGEAMALAKRSLAMQPRADEAVGYLLQAAARSEWQGEPEDLIPADLKGSTHADLGLAEFFKKRDVAGWPSKCLEIAKRHWDADEFKLIGATAILQLIIDARAYVPGAVLPVSNEDLKSAADYMQRLATRCLDVGFADRHDLVAYLNNAAVLLRLQLRQSEAETLLRRGLESVPAEPQLTRLLSLSLLAQDRMEEALAVLSEVDDEESQLLAAEITSTRDPQKALTQALQIPTARLDERHAYLRWRLLAELGLRLGDREKFTEAVRGLRTHNAAEPLAAELEIRWSLKGDGDEQQAAEKLVQLASQLTPDAPAEARFFLAGQLLHVDQGEKAIAVLEGHVDLTRPGPLTVLYLQSLAAARRDDLFKAKLREAAPEVQDSPEVLWTRASHAWNTGDLKTCLTVCDQLIAKRPKNGRVRLLKIECLIRQDRLVEITTELGQPLEELEFSNRSDQYRLATLLAHFGEVERGAALAYRLFLENRDEPRAWKTLSALILQEGRGESAAERLWDATSVGDHIAVDLTYEDGQQTLLIVEPDATLRSLDEISWEPKHPLVQSLLGSKPGDEFEGADGRRGKVAQLRHKYVARLHYVLKHYPRRFPQNFFVREVPVNTELPGGMDNFIAELKARRDWVREEEERYAKGSWPLELLAQRVGCDAIDAAVGIASQGHVLKVAVGNPNERSAAFRAIIRNAERGCVLDLLAFWTAWDLGAIDDVVAACGPAHLPQSVIDQLHARRERLIQGVRDGGLKSATYAEGKISLTEVSKSAVEEALSGLDSAISWIAAHAIISPIELSDKTPQEFRGLLEVSRAFDPLTLANEQGLLLITDDLAVRQMASSLVGMSAVWLEEVFRRAHVKQRTPMETQVRRFAGLVARGHNYVGVSGALLATAARLDHDEGAVRGRWFDTLAKMIGGAGADPASHVNVVGNCFRVLWGDLEATVHRTAAASRLLDRLLFERKDYRELLIRLYNSLAGLREIQEYISAWARGHFLS